MTYEVRVERAESRPLAAVRGTATRQRLGTEIVRLLDLVWPVVREQGVRTGHNVVVYSGAHGDELTIDAGVEVFTDCTPLGPVRMVSTPAGEVAVATHLGDYAQMGGAYAALDRWCRATGRRRAGVQWEVYGDWDEDPARLRTDVYYLLEPAADSAQSTTVQGSPSVTRPG